MLASFMLVSLFMTGSVYADTVCDEFNAIAYNGNDGTHNWSNDWQELGGVGRAYQRSSACRQ